MNREEAEKNLQRMAESTLTPGFLEQLKMLGLFIAGMGAGTVLHDFAWGLILMIIGGAFYYITIFVNKNFEWKE